MLLQKTLLNIEGLGRQLDPDLDLWSTAKPALEKWMKQQLGWRGLLDRLRLEAPHYAQLLPQLPRLLHQALQHQSADADNDEQQRLLRRQVAEQQFTNRLLGLAVYFGGGLVTGILVVQLFLRWHSAY